MIEVVEVAGIRYSGEVVPVDGEGISARVVVPDPDIVISGNQGLQTGQIREQVKTAVELIPGSDVTGKDQKVGGIVIQLGCQTEGRSRPVRVPGAIVEIGGHSDAKRTSRGRQPHRGIHTPILPA